MLRQLINDLGVRKVAARCGVDRTAVLYWCRKDRLPMRNGDAERRAHYEREIAKLAGMRVGELRKMLAEEEANREVA